MAGLVMILLLVGVSLGAALLLRWAQVPGWAVAGGVLAGIILGPSILGRAQPQWYEAIFVGGVEQRRTLDIQEQLLATAVDPDAAAAVAARQSLHEVRVHHQAPLRVLAAVAVALALAGAGQRRTDNRERPPPAAVSAMSIGAWSAVVPGGLALAGAAWLWGWEWPESVLVAAAVAIGPWRLGRFDAEAADRAEVDGARLIEAAGRVATAIALIAAAWGLRAGGGYAGLAAGWPLLAAILGWIAPLGRFRPLSIALEPVVVPVLAASVAVRVDFVGDFVFWPVVVLLIVCGDGRWFGALLGALVPGGRHGLRTMRLVLGSMAAGPTQLAVVACCLNAGALSAGPAVALILGACLIEVTAPVRRSMSRRLIETEEALEEIRDEERH